VAATLLEKSQWGGDFIDSLALGDVRA